MPFDLIETSKEMIGIRSDGAEGTRRVVQHLAPFCRRLGFQLTFQTAGNGGSRDLNLIAHTVAEGSADLCPGGLAMVTHLDTVPPGDPALWTETGGDPYRPTLKGDRIYGLGSADTKLDFLCKLKAIENIVGARGFAPLHEIFRVPVAFIGTFGEERALAGIRLLREASIISPRFALVGEPSELEPVIAHKGILYMRADYSPPSFIRSGKGEVDQWGGRELKFRGKAAHGATPHLGENAIEKALRWLFEEERRGHSLQLLEIEGGTIHNVVPDRCRLVVREGASPCPRIGFLRRFLEIMNFARAQLEPRKNDRFDPPGAVSNIGVIRGDPERIEVEFDFRLIPETDGNEIFEIFRTLPKGIRGASVEAIRSNAPLDTDPGSEIARRVSEALRAVGLSSRFAAKSGNTEGAILQAMGAEAIVIGPGLSTGNIHAPNEYNEISQLKKAVEFYEAFLRPLC